ncbi:MAG: Fic family protein [Candidatus Paceibacterota bacterium]
MENLKNKNKITEFLKESNAIERVYDEDSLEQAENAWSFLIEQRTITPAVVLRTHFLLMKNHGILDQYKGTYRNCPVWIGGREGINHLQIFEEIKKWCNDMNDTGWIDKWCKVPGKNYKKNFEHISKLLHVQYEKIHPFIDGNGRTGRMFMNWWRIKNDLPLLIIHEGKEQMDYYKWFK